MNRKLRVTKPNPRSSATKRTPAKVSKAARRVEHRAYGHGTLRYIRRLDDCSYAAAVDFGGVKRTIRLAETYFVTPISQIMALAPHLPPLPKPVAKRAKGTEWTASREMSEPELGEHAADEESAAEDRESSADEDHEDEAA
ncbi:MAG: hypothetical protein WCF26_25155 [Candidatus Sulfotelmatobacter sp.]